MDILIKKFGGTSVATLESMKMVQGKIEEGLASGKKIIAVLSAQAGETNRLLAMADKWSANPDTAECDVLVSTGEQVSVSLFTMLLKDAGIKARSLLGWQIPIITNQDLNASSYDEVINIPNTNPLISPILSIIPLQLFSYYISKEKGLDVDKPRNLAKSVTVE